MNLIPPAIHFSGDRDKAIILKPKALSLYNSLGQEIDRLGLPFLSRSFVYADGSVINVTIRKESTYNNYSGVLNLFYTPQISSIVEPSGSLLFAIYNHVDNLWYAYKNDTSELILLPEAKFHIGYETRGFESFPKHQVKGGIGLWGIHTTVDSVGSYTLSLCTSKYDLTDDSEYLTLYPDTTGLHSYQDGAFLFRFGLSILNNGVQYAINIPSAHLISDGTSGTLSMPKSLTSSSLSSIAICVGSVPPGSDIATPFTGRYSNGTFFSTGLYPYSCRRLGFSAVGLKIYGVSLVEPVVTNTKGTAVINQSYSYNSSALGLVPPSTILFACLTRSAGKVITGELSSAGDSYLICAIASKINTKLWARKLTISKYSVDSSGGLGSKTDLFSFELTEEDMSFYTSYTGPAVHNRYKNSVLGGFTLLKETNELCFIKKEQSYIKDTDISSIGTHDNILLETVKSIKINVVSGITSETVLFSTSITDRIVVSSTSPLTIARYLVDGGQVANDLMYADFSKNLFVFGIIELDGINYPLNHHGALSDPTPSAGLGNSSLYKWQEGSLSLINTRQDNALLFANFASDQSPNVPSASSSDPTWNPYFLWSSFETTAFSTGTIRAEIKTYTNWNGTGVFSDNRIGTILATVLPTRDYYVSTSGNIVQIGDSHDGGYRYTPFLVRSDELPIV